jgi:hypothetical protein
MYGIYKDDLKQCLKDILGKENNVVNKGLTRSFFFGSSGLFCLTDDLVKNTIIKTS